MDIVQRMTAVRPLDWIPEIEASIVALDEKPQFRVPSPLNWELVEKELQTLLGRTDLKLSHTLKGWETSRQLFKGLSNHLFSLAIEFSPLKVPAYFVTDEYNLKELMTLLFKSPEAGTFFYESPYVEGFYNYFAVEVLRILEKQPFSTPLTPRLGRQPENVQKVIGEESCFIIELCLTLGGKNFWGRVLLAEAFRSDWKAYFAHLRPPTLTAEMREKINVELALEVAHSRLKLEEWQKVKKGDFILLDRCSYDPLEHRGAVVLTLKQKPVFRGRFKEGGIKITNYPVYEEAGDAMEEEPYNKNFGRKNEDEDLYGDLGENEDSEFEEEEDDDIFTGLEPRKENIKQEAEPPVVAQYTPPSAEEGTSITPAELPVHLTVEVGRIHMTVGALMNLAPGNLLELNVSPEQGVDLVVNGKKVGRGELIRMGDVLGVRILSL